LAKDAAVEKEKIRASAEASKAGVVELLVKTALTVDLDNVSSKDNKKAMAH
jgi:hypothetical protein